MKNENGREELPSWREGLGHIRNMEGYLIYYGKDLEYGQLEETPEHLRNNLWTLNQNIIKVESKILPIPSALITSEPEPKY